MTTIKTYKALQDRKYGLFVTLKNGNRVQCIFSGGSAAMGTFGTYTTRNEDIQKALESNPRFNVMYKLERTTTIESAEDIKENDSRYKDMTFKNNTEAKEFIEKEFGIKAYHIVSQSVAKQTLLEHGIRATFENTDLKDK